MSIKPTDFSINITDFLVQLPGALVATLIKESALDKLFGSMKTSLASETNKQIASHGAIIKVPQKTLFEISNQYGKPLLLVAVA